MQDPIADMLTRIRNAQAVAKEEVHIPLSTIKVDIAKVLKYEGYIDNFVVEQPDEDKNIKFPRLTVILKYFQGRPVISEIKRVSKPSLRVYLGKNDLPKIQNGLGVAIVSTSKGVMSDRKARSIGEGGEVLLFVS